MNRVRIWIAATAVLAALVGGRIGLDYLSTENEKDRVTGEFTCAMGGECD